MSDTVISVENLGKCYTLRHKRTGERYTTLRDVIARQAVAPIGYGTSPGLAHSTVALLPQALANYWARVHAAMAAIGEGGIAPSAAVRKPPQRKAVLSGF